jgi:taurine dioxygenase
MHHAAFDTLPLPGDLPFGAQVIGLELESLADAGVRKSLRDLWLQKGVLVFRGAPGAEFQIELARIFGDIVENPVREVRTARPELSTLRHKPDDSMLMEVDGELRAGWLPWHIDMIYRPRICRAGCLRTIVLPSRLGKTGFIDRLTTYEAMPEELKKRIEGLYVTYRMSYDYRDNRFLNRKVRMVRITPDAQKLHARIDDFPPSEHPMVFYYPELGRKVLNVSGWNPLGISGMDSAQSEALLHEVLSYAIDEKHAYYHDWHVDDVVIWDNWRMLHGATGHPADEERWVESVTIAGDYGCGRQASVQPQAAVG